MFSLHSVDPEFSRSFAVIIQKTPSGTEGIPPTRKYAATLYHTEFLRDRGIDYCWEMIRFNNEMVPFCKDLTPLPCESDDEDEESQDPFEKVLPSLPGEYHLKGNFEFEMCCHSKVNKACERFIKLIYGQSGSGKTVTLAKLIKRYRQAFPANNVIYGSVNSLENEPAFKEFVDPETKKSLIRELNLAKVTTVIDVFRPEFKNALLLFDDLDANCGVFRPVDLDPTLTPEVVATLPLKEKRAIARQVREKMASVSADVRGTAISAVFNARKQNLSFCYIFHEFFANRFENQLLGEAKSVVLFPSGADQATLQRWLTKKLLLSKPSAKALTERTWAKWDFLEIDKSTGRKFALMNDSLKLL